MRQFFTVRFWAALGALAGLALALFALVRPSEQLVVDDSPPTRRMDVIALAAGVIPDEGFAIDGGRVQGTATVVLLGGRELRLVDGVPGETTCEAIAELGGCVFAADLLGDAVVWFSLLPASAASGAEYPLPPIVELLDGVTWARLDNGWEVPLLAVVSRRCDEETTSLGDFVERFGRDHVTVFDLDEGEVSAVRCGVA
ncbi:MAG: hypothetical protein IPM43_08960 [Actinomycetota bacterium]|nr:MAG: hypothetical protein IPM43_08960 [Actinomycetota bacterium]